MNSSLPLILVACGALAVVGLWFISWKVGTFLGVLQREATTNGKRIEFAGALIALLALIATIMGLIYSAVKIDALEDRVIALERTVGAMKSVPKTEK